MSRERRVIWLAIVRRLIALGANVLAVGGSKDKLPVLGGISGAGLLETFVADVSEAQQVLAYAELWGQIDGFDNKRRNSDEGVRDR